MCLWTSDKELCVCEVTINSTDLNEKCQRGIKGAICKIWLEFNFKTFLTLSTECEKRQC